MHIYPAAAHAQSGVKQSVPSICRSVGLSVIKNILKCLLNARFKALKNRYKKKSYILHVRRFQDGPYCSIPSNSIVSELLLATVWSATWKLHVRK